MERGRARAWILRLSLALAGACAAPDYANRLAAGSPALLPLARGEEVPSFASDWERREEILPALDQSIAWMRRPRARETFPTAGIEHARALASLERFRELLVTSADGAAFQRVLEEEFQVYKSAGWDGQGGGVLFTAYCTPLLRGSLVATEEYRYPLYALPADLVRSTAGTVEGWETPLGRFPRYPSRAVIEATGLLAGSEVAWLADPIDAYLAHVNGSAFIELPDGSIQRLGYAGKNGRPYRSLGKELEADGRIPHGGVDLAAIRAWAAGASGEELCEYLERNECYVFFTPIDGNPHGSLDVEVTPGRTLATDKTLFPRGALTYASGPNDEPAVNRFLLDQDTGGAIQTAGRADLYLGIGREAEEEAGRTRIEGQLYYLFLREGRE